MASEKLFNPFRTKGRGRPKGSTKAAIRERKAAEAKAAADRWHDVIEFPNGLKIVMARYRCRFCRAPLMQKDWRLCPSCGCLNEGKLELIPRG